MPKVDSVNLLIEATLAARLAQSSGRLDSQARTQRVLAATLMECAEKGYSDMTIAGIAKRARASTASIYATYQDRDALLVAAMEMLFAIVAGDVIEIPKTENPKDKVEHLLIAHGSVYAQPLAVWYFRLHLTLVRAGHRHLQETGLQVFRGIDAFWRSFLSDLVQEGHLRALDLDRVVPALLGPIERCTIISRLGYGDDEPHRPSLAAVARHSADQLFRLWGSSSKGSGSAAIDAVDATTLRRVDGLGDAPSGNDDDPRSRLAAELAHMPLRQSPKARKERILLAAAVIGLERGYNAAGVHDIAARARVSTATVYKHYREKPDLFISALETEWGTHAPVKGETKPKGTRAQDLAQVIYDIATHAVEPSRLWRHDIVMASAISGTPRVVAQTRSQRQEVEAHLARIIAETPHGSDLDPTETALAVNALLGAVERSGVLALMLFGQDAVDRHWLAELSAVAARDHFARYGC